MADPILALGLIGALVLLDLAAVLWGVDSRDGFRGDRGR